MTGQTRPLSGRLRGPARAGAIAWRVARPHRVASSIAAAGKLGSRPGVPLQAGGFQDLGQSCELMVWQGGYP
jgi:hypothetical protein